MTGALEPTNCAYAVAKIAGLTQVTAIRHQYRLPYISAMPSNVYGPNDNFDPHTSHVVPAMIRRFHDAVVRGPTRSPVGVPGRPVGSSCSPTTWPMRAHSWSRTTTTTPHQRGDRHRRHGGRAGLHCRQRGRLPGDIRWDCGRPDGTPVKRLDVSRLQALGWTTRTDLAQGIKDTYEWFVAHQDSYRGRSVHAEGPSS